MLKKTLASSIIIILLILITGNSFSALAQEAGRWSPQQNIPGYHPETWSPILLADQNRTVHAFTYQWLGEEFVSIRAIVYNQWTLEGGWTEPVDILLSPKKNDARLTDAFLDHQGMIHLVFWGGDNTDADIYYSRAPAIYAGNVTAWSKPMLVAKNAADPQNAVFYSRNSNQLGILFSSIEQGNGVYSIVSRDSGITWSEPLLISNSEDDLLVQMLQVFDGQSGLVHAVWNEITPGSQGRIIIYSRWKLGESNWSEPIQLAEAESGLGTQTPAIIEYQGEVFAFFNINRKIVFSRSKDDGVSWSEPVPLFRHHVGVNGSLSPVIDGEDNLHLFFGQRISGSPDIHGMWHSLWLGNNWSEPEPVVSGPAVHELSGDTRFDPYEAQAVVSQGNVVLVTWISDPGAKGNGVWYSYQILEASELPIVPLISVEYQETPQSPLPISTQTPLVQNDESGQNDYSNSIDLNDDFQNENNPTLLILIGIVPAVLLIIVVILIRRISNLV